MDLIQLKMPPERIALLAQSIQRDITASAPEDQVKELSQILAWLRYRHAKWQQAQPARPPA
jgi:hypothetical protein